MEEDINEHQFRKEVQEVGLEGERVQGGYHTLVSLLPMFISFNYRFSNELSELERVV